MWVRKLYEKKFILFIFILFPQHMLLLLKLFRVHNCRCFLMMLAILRKESSTQIAPEVNAQQAYEKLRRKPALLALFITAASQQKHVSVETPLSKDKL